MLIGLLLATGGLGDGQLAILPAHADHRLAASRHLDLERETRQRVGGDQLEHLELEAGILPFGA